MAGTPTKVLSRDFKISVNTGSEAVPAWTQIMGLGDDGIAISPSSPTSTSRTRTTAAGRSR